MGSCVSVRRESDVAMKLKLSFGYQSNKFVIPSPVKDNDRPIAEPALKSQWSSTPPATTAFGDSGSKEEKFFDSQPWLESDCDDDFFSVNGDFTPSRGNTPVHQSISMRNSRISKALFEDRAPKAVPTTTSPTNKKKLAELFRDSSRGFKDADGIISSIQNNGEKEARAVTPGPYSKSIDGTPSAGSTPVSYCGKRTPNGDAKSIKARSIRSVQCCLPSLSTTCSYSESKQKANPPPYTCG